MAFRSTTRSDLFLDRPGYESERDPAQLKKVSDYLIKMGMLRECIRSWILESNDGGLTISEALAVRNSPIQGLGVFAMEPISADADLGAAQILLPSGRYDVTELGKYHNHSSNPTCYNAWIGNERHLFPYNDLEPGTEITIDYTQQPDLEQPKDNWY